MTNLEKIRQMSIEEMVDFCEWNICGKCANQPNDYDECEGNCDVGIKKWLQAECDEPTRRRMTHRELARWLAEGNGEWCHVHNHSQYVSGISFIYKKVGADKPCYDILIRRWDETEWHEPLVEK